jgi:negative regulator of sigma E activity
MSVSDFEVIAYVDGELDPARRAEIERELAHDPELQQRVAEEQALRDRFRRVFDRVLDEPVPSRLVASLKPTSLRASRPPSRTRWQWAWTGGLAAAAGLVLGVALGQWLPSLQGQPAPIATVGSMLEARGALADALTRRLASEQAPSNGVRLGVSFLARAGVYCRTFSLEQGRDSLSGLACRDHDVWELQALQSTPRESHAADGMYRQAASALPPAIAAAVDAAIAGEALDAAGEARARSHCWQTGRKVAAACR